MICEAPLRIRNKYTGDWLYVNCRKCDACLALKAVINTCHLQQYLKDYLNVIFVTLTYDNSNLPVVLPFMSGIYRYNDNDLPDKIEDTEERFDFECNLPNGAKYPCTGVIYYRDFQLFFKRFRKYINRKYGKINFRFFGLCEYGSKSLRPHYHVLFLSDSLSYDAVKDGVIKNWRLCDWSKLSIDECFKFGTNGLASYLSSYVNCLCNRDGLYKVKRFRQKVTRSKDVSFSVDVKMEDEVKRYLGRRFNEGVNFENSQFFRYRGRVGKGVSPQLVSTEFLSTYFSHPKRHGDLSPDAEFRRIAEILRFYQTRTKIANISGLLIEADSSDYRVWLSYNKYCRLLNLDAYDKLNVVQYCHDYLDVWSYYSSLRLIEFYKTIDSLPPLVREYEFYNTLCDDLEKRFYRRYFKLRVDLDTLDLYERNVLSPRVQKTIESFVIDNKTKLLPKHLQQNAKYI